MKSWELSHPKQKLTASPKPTFNKINPQNLRRNQPGQFLRQSPQIIPALRNNAHLLVDAPSPLAPDMIARDSTHCHATAVSLL
jgi:hypothetical protein